MTNKDKWIVRILASLMIWFLAVCITDITRRRTPHEFGLMVDELQEKVMNLEKVTGDIDHEIIRARESF